MTERERFRQALRALDAAPGQVEGLTDGRVVEKWRVWLGEDLPWSGPGITDDEWFFVTTLCGTMTVDGQRTHIRTFLPRFVEGAEGAIERCTHDLVAPWRLRSPWMKTRLSRMGELLRRRSITMATYSDELRALDAGATPRNPMPALDRLCSDLRSTTAKTLSLFVRDCILGHCFPIDSRVESTLERFRLPNDERRLVSLSLEEGRNPREAARLFYDGGERAFFGA